MKPRGEPQLLAALRKADPAVRLYLFHGPDESAAHAYADMLLQALGVGAERVSIESPQLRGDPGRLTDEARSLALFGGRRMLLLTGAGEDALAAVELLLASDGVEHPAVLIGPGLKSTGKLVKLAIAHPAAMAQGCYLPEGDKADALVVALARAEGLRATPGAARRLAQAAGGDRAVMAREIEKLALYLDAAPEHPRELDDAALDAIGADLSDGDIGPMVEAMLAGRAAELGAKLAQLRERGASMIPLFRALVRRLMTLAEIRAAIDSGDRADDAAKRAGGFWREVDSNAAAVRRWRADQLSVAITALRQAERAQMDSHGPGEVAGDCAILALARR